MSCNKCNRSSCDGTCYQARLSLGLDQSKSSLIGSLDGVYIKPVPLKSVVATNESDTNLHYDPSIRALVYNNEQYKRGEGQPDYIPTRSLLSGADISEIGNIGSLIEGGLASVARSGSELNLQFSIPIPIGATETSTGFITYVPNPVDGIYYKRIQPSVGGVSDTVLIGHPDGTIEFANPIVSPVLVPTTNLTTSGHFSGTPSTTSGTWRYQQMGQSQVITNTSGSKVEVSIHIRWSMQTAGSRSGFYCSLVNGGTDYQQNFVEGVPNIKSESYPGGEGVWTAVLDPNQRAQFSFGGWTNTAGNMEITVGSIDESAGNTIHTVIQPAISIRRLL